MSNQRLFRIDEGTGPPVILVHGFGCSSVQWMYTVPALVKAGYRAVAIDLPGFGRSYLPEAPITTSSYAHSILALLDELGLEKAILVGNSMGAFASWYAASLAPERVSALVLSNAAGLSDRQNREAAERRPRGRSLLAPSFVTKPFIRSLLGSPLTNPLTRRIVAPSIRMSFANQERITPEIFNALHQAAKQARIVFSNRLRWEPLGEETSELFRRITCPVLIIWGDQDRIIPLRAMELFTTQLPQAQTAVYQGVGHVPMLETPEQFNDSLLSFLKKS